METAQTLRDKVKQMELKKEKVIDNRFYKKTNKKIQNKDVVIKINTKEFVSDDDNNMNFNKKLRIKADKSKTKLETTTHTSLRPTFNKNEDKNNKYSLLNQNSQRNSSMNNSNILSNPITSKKNKEYGIFTNDPMKVKYEKSGNKQMELPNDENFIKSK